MNLDEFKEQENNLKDIALELMQKQKECESLRIEHQELFKYLKNQSRLLGLRVVDGQFIIP